MKTAKNLYKEYLDDSYWFNIGNYQPMLESFGEIVLQVDDNDYQGDSRVIYKDGSEHSIRLKPMASTIRINPH